MMCQQLHRMDSVKIWDAKKASIPRATHTVSVVPSIAFYGLCCRGERLFKAPLDTRLHNISMNFNRGVEQPGSSSGS